MSSDVFTLPVSYDIAATTIFAATGALFAAKRGFDLFGIFIVAIVSGAGGGILRDAIFLNTIPAVILDWRYVAALFAGISLVIAFRSVLQSRFVGIIVVLVDALALGMYGVFGTQKALAFGLGVLSAIIVGVVNAIGGGLLRESLMGGPRTALNPGQFYGILAVSGVLIYTLLSQTLTLSNRLIAWMAIIIVFVLRLFAIKYNWQTTAVEDMRDPSEILVSKSKKVVRKLSPTNKSGNRQKKLDE